MKFDFNNTRVELLFPYEGKQLYIPRYQRDYSWESKEISEFMNDILSRINLINDNVQSSDYFFGTLLFALDDNIDGKVEVIDGQQRITTITIFLSALAKCFYNMKENEIGDLVWKKIMSKNRNAKIFKTVKNDTANNYFEYLVQMKNECNKNPIDDEQDRIKYAYEYFINTLSETNLKNKLHEIHNDINYLTVDYIELLKVVRDQLFYSRIICIETSDKNSSNLVFEILNGKGKKLDSIDLIKNRIFENINETEPTDKAYDTWSSVKNTLCSRKERVEFQTFLRHYWAYKYTKVVDDDIYNEFLKEIKPSKYEDFLNDIDDKSKIYMQIVSPTMEDYDNRKEKQYILESLKYLNDYFKIKQTRIVLLSIFDAKNRNVIKNKKLKQILVYLHQFHFVYNGLCTKRANKLDSKYTKFARELNNCDNSSKGHIVVDNFIKELDSIFPSYKEFESQFIKLEYSKKNNPNNMLSKYVLNSFERYYSKEDISKFNGTIEHIIPENPLDKLTLNIGNLILLEDFINEKASTLTFDKKIEEYEESHYKYVSNFCKQYSSNTNSFKDNINKRAKLMANDFYYNILGRPKDNCTKKDFSNEKSKEDKQLSFAM